MINEEEFAEKYGKETLDYVNDIFYEQLNHVEFNVNGHGFYFAFDVEYLHGLGSVESGYLEVYIDGNEDNIEQWSIITESGPNDGSVLVEFCLESDKEHYKIQNSDKTIRRGLIVPISSESFSIKKYEAILTTDYFVELERGWNDDVSRNVEDTFGWNEKLNNKCMRGIVVYTTLNKGVNRKEHY